MKSSFIKLSFILLLPLFLGASCSLSSSSTGGKAGVWWSQDHGKSWEQRSFVKFEKNKPVTIGAVSVTQLVMFPINSQRIYANTSGGIYYTENSGQYWKKIFTNGAVADISTEYDKEGVVYAAQGNQLLMTPDNGGIWNPLYVESRGGVTITQVAVDPFDGQRIYIGTSVGDLLLSQDGGQSWQTIHEFKSSIKEILIDPRNSKEIFIATPEKGMWASYDGAYTWTSLQEFYNDYEGANQFIGLMYDESRPGALLYASSYGLLWTFDHGTTWQPLELLTPPNSIAIKAMAINPLNPNMIYYATDTVLYRTLDGGVNWIAEKLPVPYPGALVVDFYNPDNVFMGVRVPPKEKKGLFNPSF